MAAVRTALVTGSTDGIGRETAMELLRRGLRVVVHGRSDAKVGHAVEEIRQKLGKGVTVEGWACDLSSLAQVREKAPALLALAPQLHVLLHNAGVYQADRKVTPEGFELTLAVSHLAPFLLTRLMLPSLLAAAPARVIAVSSGLHQSGQIDLADLQLARRYTGGAAYAQAKLCNVLFANGLAARFEPAQLTANSLHPGVVGTKLLKAGFGMRSGPDSLEEGAATSVFLALSPGVSQVSGRYFVRSRETPPAPQSRSEKLREELWSASESLTGAKWDPPRR